MGLGTGLASLSAFAKLWDSIVHQSHLMTVADYPRDDNAYSVAFGGLVL
jgi:hypothetical protein